MSMSLTGVAAAVSTLLAASTIWLLLTDPATVAGAISDGRVTPLVRELVSAILDAVRGLLTYL
jgi:hypothetical protein